MNEDTFAHLEICTSEEGVVRGDERFRHRARFDPIEFGGNTRKVAFRHDNKLCLRPARSDPENAVANFPCLNRFAERFDFTGKFEARDVLRITGRRGIFPAALHEIRAIQARGMHPHADAVDRGCRRQFHLLHADPFDPAGFTDDDRSHPEYRKNARPLLFALWFLQLKRGRVHLNSANPLRLRSVVENVAEMSVAASAEHFCPLHEEFVIGLRADGLVRDWRVEAGPPEPNSNFASESKSSFPQAAHL